MDETCRFEDTGDLEEEWSPSNTEYASPSHRSVAASEPQETSEEYSDDFDTTTYYDDVFYDDVDTEETQEEDADPNDSDQQPAANTTEEPAWEELAPWRPPETDTQEEDPGPSQPTSPVAATEEPAWEDLAPWRPPETDTQEEDPGSEQEADDPQDEDYSDDFVNEETDHETSRLEATTSTVTADEEEDPGPSQPTSPAAATEEPAWEDLAPWRPPETDTQEQDPGSEQEADDPQDEDYSDDFVNEETDHETSRLEATTSTVTADEEPAWEDLAPWRPPETDTQEEDPGPSQPTSPVAATEEPAWEDLAPWRPPETDTQQEDPGQEVTQEREEVPVASDVNENPDDPREDDTLEQDRTPIEETLEEELNLTLEQKRLRFEGRSETIKVPKKVKKKTLLEATQFLESLRAMGGGSAGVAWRRLFENDEVKFDDFCGALVTLHFQGDVIRLWHQLAGPSTSHLKFEAVDKESAAVLNAFTAWCKFAKNGPLEVFRVIDQAHDGSDSLTSEKFVDGLQKLGFFNAPASLEDRIWEKLNTRDPQKRALVLRDRSRRRMKRRPPEAHKSEKIIHKLLLQTTAIGNKHWAQVPDGHVAVGRPSTSLPKVKRPLPRAVSAPEFAATLDLKFLDEQDDLLAANALLDNAMRPNSSPVTEDQIIAPEHRPVAPRPSHPALPKEERKSLKALLATSYRRAYCGSLVPLPHLHKVTNEPKPLMGTKSSQVQKPTSQRKKAAHSKFNPRLLNSFLTSAQESIWQHYFGASETSEGELPMLESDAAMG